MGCFQGCMGLIWETCHGDGGNLRPVSDVSLDESADKSTYRERGGHAEQHQLECDPHESKDVHDRAERLAQVPSSAKSVSQRTAVA